MNSHDTILEYLSNPAYQNNLANKSKPIVSETISYSDKKFYKKRIINLFKHSFKNNNYPETINIVHDEFIHAAIKYFKLLDKRDILQEEYDMQARSVQASCAQASSVQASSVQASSAQASSAQASSVQASSVQASSVQASSVQASSVQASSVQASSVQASSVQAYEESQNVLSSANKDIMRVKKTSGNLDAFVKKKKVTIVPPSQKVINLRDAKLKYKGIRPKK